MTICIASLISSDCKISNCPTTRTFENNKKLQTHGFPPGIALSAPPNGALICGC